MTACPRAAARRSVSLCSGPSSGDPARCSSLPPRQNSSSGKAATSATFSEPGDYILQAVVDDGSGESAGNFGYHCCWTNTQVKVTVTAAGQSTIHNPQSAIPAIRNISDIRERCRPDLPEELPDLPSPRDVGADVARQLRRSPAVGAVDPQRVSNRDMPPWHLDKTVGIRHYKNDRSLSDDEIATVVKWVDSGAAQGNPADMPAPLTFRFEGDWFIGEPDLKVTTPSDFTMYPAGPDWWIDQFADVELTEDRWVKSMEIKPSNPSHPPRRRLRHRAGCA